LPEFSGPTQHGESDATKATAHLPGLDIEIVHRRSPDGEAEQISINLRAVPSFEAFGRLIETANPFAFWAQAARLAWLPWLALTGAVLLPNSTPPGRAHAALRSSDEPSSG
jgi:hypothetical protein